MPMPKVTLPHSLEIIILSGRLGATDLVDLLSWEAAIQSSIQVKIMSINGHPLGMNARECLKGQGKNDEWRKSNERNRNLGI